MKVKTLVNTIRNLGVVKNGEKQGIAIKVDLADGRTSILSLALTTTSKTNPYGYGIDEEFKDKLYIWNVTEEGKEVEKKYKEIPELEVQKFEYNTIFNDYDIYVKDNNVLNKYWKDIWKK